MSNNIYDILKKIENLESPKQALTESKAMNTVKELHNESKKKKLTRKGTIAEAVAQVEQQLNEKYKGFKKAVGEGLQLVGTVKDTEQGREYKAEPGQRVSATFEPGTTQPKVGFVPGKPDTKAPQAAQPTEPQKPVDESGLQYHTGVKKHGKKYMDMAAELGREGASQEELGRLKDKHSKAYKNKKKSMDEGNQLPSPPDEVHLPKKGSKHGPVEVYKKPKNEDMLSAKQKEFAALAEPKDKITYADKIAGAKKDKKTEGNKFSGNLMKARAQGKDEADLDGDGDMEKVTPGKTMREGWDEMQKYLDKKKGPESKGGAGKKAGTRYGGSAQKDDEDTDGEGKSVEKKKGRPKGTGGGAKFSFKKPKD